MLAWCTAHWLSYKQLRGRLPHGLGSTPSASTMRSKLIRMSRRFLPVRQLVRFQPDAPSFQDRYHQWRWTGFLTRTRWVRTPLDPPRYSPMSSSGRTAEFQSANGSSILLIGANMAPSSNWTRHRTTNPGIGVRLAWGLPSFWARLISRPPSSPFET
jgi:hypothetical protein